MEGVRQEEGDNDRGEGAQRETGAQYLLEAIFVWWTAGGGGNATGIVIGYIFNQTIHHDDATVYSTARTVQLYKLYNCVQLCTTVNKRTAKHE